MNTWFPKFQNGMVTCAMALLASLFSAAAETNSVFSYVAYRFAPEEGWRLRGSGNLGASRLEGRILRFDFTQGAASIALGLPDRVLLGEPGKFRLRVRGSAKGHPVRVQLRTHFMTFEKAVGELSGDGEQEWVFDAPPGHDWKWFGGENDGKLHGPLRLGEIRLEAGATKDSGQLELLGLAIDGSCPSNRLCVMVASATTADTETRFTASMRSVADTLLEGQLRWAVRVMYAGAVNLENPPKHDNPTLPWDGTGTPFDNRTFGLAKGFSSTPCAKPVQ